MRTGGPPVTMPEIEVAPVTYSEVMDRLEELGGQYSDVLTVDPAGTSPKGYDIPGVVVRPTGEVRGTMMVVAGQHFSEAAGPPAALDFLEGYLSSEDPVYQEAREHIALAVVPCVNVDRYQKRPPCSDWMADQSNALDQYLNDGYGEAGWATLEERAVMSFTDHVESEYGTIDVAMDLHETSANRGPFKALGYLSKRWPVLHRIFGWSPNFHGFLLNHEAPPKEEDRGYIEAVLDAADGHMDPIRENECSLSHTYQGYAASKGAMAMTTETNEYDPFELRVEVQESSLDAVLRELVERTRE